MPQCHKCNHKADIEAGKYRNVPWNKTPCSKCRLSDTTPGHGKNRLSFTPEDWDGNTMVETRIQWGAETPVISYAQEEPHPALDAIREVARVLLHLDPVTRDILLYRLLHPGKPLRMISAHVGISIQAVHARLKNAKTKHEAIAKLINIQSRGKHAERNNSRTG